MNEGISVILELNTAVESLPLPLLDDADDSSAGSDGGAGESNFGVVHGAGVSLSAQLMRRNADIDL